MEFNLALNTIMYIMVFIVPGFLFRRFFYSNQFSNEFFFGNLFERFIWTLMFSFLMLFSYYILTTLFSFFNPDLVITYEMLKEMHSGIQQLDKILPEKEVLYTFLTLITFIWSLSVLLGFISHKIAVVLNYSFYNYWEALLTGKKIIKPNDFKYLYTQVDILTHNNVLYQGIFKKYFLAKNSNELETIFLDRVRKREKEGYFKDIPGHNFCFHKSDIENINLTYVYMEKNEILSRYFVKFILIIIYLLVFFGSTYFVYTNQTALDTLTKKIIFVFCGFVFFSVLANIIYSRKKPSYESFIFLISLFWIGISVYFNIDMLWVLLVSSLIIFSNMYRLSPTHNIIKENNEDKQTEQTEQTEQTQQRKDYKKKLKRRLKRKSKKK